MLLRISAVLLLCSVRPPAQDLTKYRVALKVSADEDLTKVVTSALAASFRGIGDTSLVDSNPQYIVRVTGIQTRARRGSKLRVILAYSFTTVYENDLAPLFDPKELPPQAARNVADLVRTLEQYRGGGVVTARLNGIGHACAGIVGVFNSVVLDEGRKAVREVSRTHGAIGK